MLPSVCPGGRGGARRFRRFPRAASLQELLAERDPPSPTCHQLPGSRRPSDVSAAAATSVAQVTSACANDRPQGPATTGPRAPNGRRPIHVDRPEARTDARSWLPALPHRRSVRPVTAGGRPIVTQSASPPAGGSEPAVRAEAAAAGRRPADVEKRAMARWNHWWIHRGALFICCDGQARRIHSVLSLRCSAVDASMARCGPSRRLSAECSTSTLLLGDAERTTKPCEPGARNDLRGGGPGPCAA